MTFSLDMFLVGLFLGNSAQVASYKVATMLPERLLFVPGSLIVFAMPYFVEHNKDRLWFASKGRLFICASSALFGIIALLLVVLAPWIIELLWGVDYLDATWPFRLLSACFAFSVIRTTFTNLLCALRAVRSGLVVSLISLVLNIALCLILIPRYGIDGAAIAPLSVSVVAAVVATVMLRRSILKVGET